MKEQQSKYIRDFKAKHSVEGLEENVVTTIHLMNSHSMDKDSALDQSSRGKNDYGIDGWHYDEKRHELHIYQSKYSESKKLVLDGLSDFLGAGTWLEKVLVGNFVDILPSNPSIVNLYTSLSINREKIRKIRFVLISPYNESDLVGREDYEKIEKRIRESLFFQSFAKNDIQIGIDIQPYNFDRSIPYYIKKYEVKKLPNTTINLRADAQLDLAYIPLHSLVYLYRQRGDLLFHKNVRLSLYHLADAKNRVVNPMRKTLDDICNENLPPSIFPFYHVGITIAATKKDKETSPGTTNLESPYVLNGCQSITIAHHYLSELEKNKAIDKIKLFEQINIIAKIVIGTSDEELREITISNNRQNPIENWQLFSNDYIHIEIEDILKNKGIFYERQKGKFEAIMKVPSEAKNYYFTNGTFLDIKKLAQVISVGRGLHQFTAKVSDIFNNQSNHDKVFDKKIGEHFRDMIYVWNIFIAAKRGLENYLQKPAHYNDETHAVFVKPIVKAHVHWLLVLYYYQKYDLNTRMATVILKKASPKIVDDIETICMKIVTKIKNYYNAEMGKTGDVPTKKLTPFFEELAIEIGINFSTEEVPFSDKAINYSEYDLDQKPFGLEDITFEDS